VSTSRRHRPLLHIRATSSAPDCLTSSPRIHRSRLRYPPSKSRPANTRVGHEANVTTTAPHHARPTTPSLGISPLCGPNTVAQPGLMEARTPNEWMLEVKRSDARSSFLQETRQDRPPRAWAWTCTITIRHPGQTYEWVISPAVRCILTVSP